METATKTKLSVNNLFPVFLKLEDMQVVLFGAGPVGLEKLQALLKQSPKTTVKVIALEVSNAFADFAAQNQHQVSVTVDAYHPKYLADADIVVAAVNNLELAAQIRDDAKAVGKLINVADTPDLCDFYLSSIVHKGNLKIAISTNGKSPTMAKRLKEVLNDALPAGIEESLDNLQQVRNQLKGDFEAKVEKLNAITRVLVDEDPAEEPIEKQEQKWKKVANWCLFALFFMFAGHAVFSLIPYGSIQNGLVALQGQFDERFWWMLAAGFFAQLVDGALGMGYGVISTVTLLSAGVNLSAISGSIHTAEMFSSGASGYSHYKFGNVNKKLFRAMLIPGVAGAIIGSLLLCFLGDKYAEWVRPVLSVYTLILGIRIFSNAFRKNRTVKKVKRVGWLAGAGGFLDSFGGGGWGPLVTSTLISKGRSPRFVIGTVSITEFFVTVASAVTFFLVLGASHWQVILGLIIGGLVAAPFAARMAGKLPVKTMFILVGILIIFSSIRILLKTLGI